jgi:hypothetical protein
MNPKIKSLANVWANRRQVEERTDTVYYVFSEKALQVFADKIVLEAVCVVKSKCASPTASEALLKHFGVDDAY